MSRTPVTALTACVALAALAACAPTPVEEAAPGTPTENADARYPVTVENCGREVTLDAPPERVVAFEGAAETVFALDAAAGMAGYFGSAPDDLPADLADGARQTAYLGASFPFPSAEQVLEQTPDLVLVYGFSDDGGLAEQLEAQGVPWLGLSEGCLEGADASVEAYLDDVEVFASALGVPDAGTELVERWRAELPAPAAPGDDAPVVVVYGNQDPTQPFVSTGGSFVQAQLDWAGAANAYADSDAGYLTPSWEDIASREPDIIFSGGGGGEDVRQGLEDYLTGNAALAQIPAVQDEQVLSIEYAQNVPGPQAIEGIRVLADAVAAHAS